MSGVRPGAPRIVLAALLAAALPFGPALADGPQGDAIGNWSTAMPSPTGRWATPTHDAVIQISQCGKNLCGRIVGMALAPGQPEPKDWQGKSQCGLTIIQVTPGTDGDGDQTWTGSIVDPRDGSVYHALIRVGGSNNLLLRGYLGIPLFGQTQTWTKYAGAIAPSDCRLKG